MANTNFLNYIQSMAGSSVSMSIKDMIIDALMSGSLKPGDKLPTETEFVERLKVGRNSVREAIKMLSSIGIIEIHRGDGTYITEKMSSSVISPLILSLVSEQQISSELVELRLLLETAAAELIIKKINEDGIRRLEQANAKLRAEATKQNHDLHVYRNLDLGFHKEFYELCGNRFLAKISEAIYALFYASIEKTVEADPFLAVRNHDLIIDAIRTRNLDLTRENIRRSLSFWIEYIQKTESPH